MIVSDDNLGAFEIAKHVLRHELATRIIAVWVVRLKYAEPIADGQARRDDEKAAPEPLPS